MSAPTLVTPLLDIERLTDTLRIADGHLIGFAIFDTLRSRRALMAELEERLEGERAVHEIESSDDEPDILPLLESVQRPTPSGDPPRALGGGGRTASNFQLPSAYFVFGFDRLGEEGKRIALTALNLRRDTLSKFNAPIIFWLTELQLHDIMRYAADLFSHRSGIYDFRVAVPEGHDLERVIPQMLGTFDKSLIPADELRKRVSLFEATLQRLQTDKQPNEAAIAQVYLDLGLIHDELAEYDAALAAYAESRAISERIGDMAGLAQTIGNIGNVHDAKGEYDAALAAYAESRAISERIGDTAGLAMTLWNIALVYEKQGRFSEAWPLMERTIEFERRIGHPDAVKDAEYLRESRAKHQKKVFATR